MAAVTVVLSASSLREDQVEQLRHKFSQIEFAVPSNDAAYAALIPNAHVVVGGFRQEHLPQARNLQWIQNSGAGVDRLLTPELIASDVIVTNAQSLHATQISEHVLAMMLAFARDFRQIFFGATRARVASACISSFLSGRANPWCGWRGRHRRGIGPEGPPFGHARDWTPPPSQ